MIPCLEATNQFTDCWSGLICISTFPCELRDRKLRNSVIAVVCVDSSIRIAFPSTISVSPNLTFCQSLVAPLFSSDSPLYLSITCTNVLKIFLHPWTSVWVPLVYCRLADSARIRVSRPRAEVAITQCGDCWLLDIAHRELCRPVVHLGQSSRLNVSANRSHWSRSRMTSRAMVRWYWRGWVFGVLILSE